MKNRWSLKGQNRGASLIAVLAAIVFVGVIGIVITQITITNIQMKEMEQQGKKNFYSAETVLDDLVAGLNAKAAGAMQEAYTDMLAQYRTVTAGSGDVQQTFRRLYMDNLIELFGAAPEPANDPKKKKDGAGADAKVTYEVGYYSVKTIKKSFTTEEEGAVDADGNQKYLYEDCLRVDCATAPGGAKFDDSAAYYQADYAAGTFVLEGIKVTSKNDATGYETTIQTDVVFSTPDLSFENNSMVKEFMRYSLVADRAINVNTTGVSVDGNIYAGDGGIYGDTNASNGTFTGGTIVTRGDISVTSGATLTVGKTDLSSKIYAENVRTVDVYGTPLDSAPESKLTLQGSSYIADDLELDGKKSLVTLKGNYYGYNYRKHYGAGGDDKASQYSSAIVLNGRSARLNMEGLKYLVLAGRTYLERNAGSADVAFGESVSARSNQMAYYVPDSFLDASDPTNVIFADPSGVQISAYMGVTNIYDYVNNSVPVTAYHYTGPFGSDTIYYLNMKSEQCANNFFYDFYESHREQVNEYAGIYVSDDSLKLGSDLIYTLKGDLLYRDGTGELNEEKVTITNSYWADNGAYFNFASTYGIKYKSLQMYLEENHAGIGPADIRFGVNNDKTQDRLLDVNNDAGNNLVNIELLKTTVASLPDKTKEIDVSRDGKNYKVILVDGDYTVTTAIQGGLIVATGDVTVYTGTRDTDSQFKGLILSGGKITFGSNACIEANEALISQIFAEDVRGGSSEFAFLFSGYDVSRESAMGEVSIDRYMSFDNWTKTVDAD